MVENSASSHAAGDLQKGEKGEDMAFTREQRRLLAVTMVPLFMSLLSVSIVNVVLPSVEADLGARSSELQWVLSGYALAFGVVLVAAGRAGDVFGRGRLFVLGIALFALGALGSGLAPSTGFLNVARVVMGIGSGFLNPQVIGMMQQFFRGVRRGRAFGLFGGTVGVSVAIGPVLGGLLVALLGSSLGWRAAFLVNVPIGLVALLAAKPWLPAGAWRPVAEDDPSSTSSMRLPAVRKGQKKAPRIDLDPVGTLLFTLAILLVMLPFMERAAGAWIWAMLPAAAVLLLVWVRWERGYAARGRAPMVDLEIFRTQSFANGSLLIAVYFMGMTSVWVLVALYMQQGLGYPALQAGLVGLPSSLASAVVAPVAGRHVVQIGRPLVLWGIGVVLVALTSSALVLHLHQTHGASVWWLSLTLGFAGVGQAMVVSPNQTLSLAEVPVRYAGSAGGVLQTGQRVGQSVGIAAITGVVFSSVAAGGWDTAVMTGFFVIAGAVFLAGLVGVRDQVQGSRRRRRE